MPRLAVSEAQTGSMVMEDEDEDEWVPWEPMPEGKGMIDISITTEDDGWRPSQGAKAVLTVRTEAGWCPLQPQYKMETFWPSKLLDVTIADEEGKMFRFIPVAPRYPDWQPMETAPPGDGRILICEKDGFVEIARRAAVGDGWIVANDPAPHSCHPAYWMPLPEWS